MSNDPRAPGQPNGHSPAPDVPPGLRAIGEGEPVITDEALADVPGIAVASMAEAAARRAQEQQEAQQQERYKQMAALLEDPAALLLSLPGIYGEALMDVVAAALVKAVNQLGGALPVKVTGRLCAECVGLQHAWAARNAAAINAAKQQAMAVIGTTSEADPRLGQIDLAAFLPEGLRPGQPQGVPQVFDAAYELDGTSLCPAHHPAAAAGKGSLIAMPGMSLHAAAQIAMSGAPGLPGLPGVPVG